ncbi:MAG: ABC transporter ATP-binding protein [candidate division WOR-3 bacterium]
MKILEISNVKKIYKTQFPFKTFVALKNISFDVLENEIFGFLGPNGAGKSTTLKIIMGILKPTEGTVSIFGKNIFERCVREKIGFLPENPSFYPFLTTYETLEHIGTLFNIEKNILSDRIKTLISLVGLENSMNSKVGTFSKGMIQRLGIAVSLINDPQLLVLDEPMSGLDPIGRKEIKDIIITAKKRGKTVIFSTHILPDIEMIADKVCVINKGEIVGTGYVHEIIKREIKEIDIEIFSNENILEKIKRFKEIAKFFSIHEKKVFITVEKEDVASEIVKIVNENNGKIVSYIPREFSLEDYFMKLMER